MMTRSESPIARMRFLGSWFIGNQRLSSGYVASVRLSRGAVEPQADFGQGADNLRGKLGEGGGEGVSTSDEDIVMSRANGKARSDPDCLFQAPPHPRPLDGVAGLFRHGEAEPRFAGIGAAD